GFDLNGLYYLPDFKVIYPHDKGYSWFEVKSSVQNLSDDDIKKMTLFAKYVQDIYLLDGTPNLRAYLHFSKESNGLVEDYTEYSDTDDFLNYSEDEMVKLNKRIFKSEGINNPSTRWGDILYTHED